MAIGDFYTSVIGISTPGGCSQISFDWEMTDGTMTFATLAILNEEIRDNKLDLLVLCLSSNAEIDSIVTRAVTNEDDVPGITNMNGLDGTIISPPLPNNMAAVLKQVTNAPNAKHNGRIFIPGVPEVAMESGKLSAAQQTLFNTFGTELLVPIVLPGPEDAIFDSGVISRHAEGLPRLDPVFFSGTQYVIDDDIRQQRRRMTERKGIST